MSTHQKMSTKNKFSSRAHGTHLPRKYSGCRRQPPRLYAGDELGRPREFGVAAKGEAEITLPEDVLDSVFFDAALLASSGGRPKLTALDGCRNVGHCFRRVSCE